MPGIVSPQQNDRPLVLTAEMQAFLDRFGAAATPFEPGGIDVVALRKDAARVRETLLAGAPVVAENRDFMISTLWGRARARMMRARIGQRTPAVLYLHGGGWTIGSVDTHRRLMLEYAVRTGFAIIGLDYALAPEAPFPTAVYQCAAALAAVALMADELQIDPTRIAIAGDSAGANLAVAASLAAIGCGAPGPRAILASYGVFDSSPERQSYRLYDRQELLLHRAKMAWFWDQYAPTQRERNHPLASPLHADLRSLPPVHVTVAEIDILADENLAFVEKARESGVATELALCSGAVHGFLEAGSGLSASRDALVEQCQWLDSLLGARNT